MGSTDNLIQLFREVGDINIVRIVIILAGAWAILLLDKHLLPRIARTFPGKLRMHLLALIPTIRLVVLVAATVMVVRRIVEPTVENMVALFGFVGVGLGFALKDYSASLIAGTISLYERPFRPGDWITVDGVYGEVQSIEFRSVNIRTPGDTLVVIPHSTVWKTPIHNANNGTTRLQCTAEFYLDPRHDGAAVRRRLRDVALTSPYMQLMEDAVVVSAETRWGTRYRLRAYPLDPDQQFAFITDLTERGKAALIAMGAGFATAAAAVAE